jgi:hypothetical protein
MAETKWSWTDPHAPISKAADFVRHVGPGWAETGKVDRTDPTFHQPLFDPSMVPQPGPPPEPVPQPSELELRDRLKTALAVEQEATTALDNAQAAHERAKALVQTSSQELVKFDSLEAEIAADTTEALRTGSGRYSLPNEVEDKLVAREVAKAAWAAAGTSEQQLADDVAQARDKLRVRQRITHAAMVPLLGFGGREDHPANPRPRTGDHPAAINFSRIRHAWAVLASPILPYCRGCAASA